MRSLHSSSLSDATSAQPPSDMSQEETIACIATQLDRMPFCAITYQNQLLSPIDIAEEGSLSFVLIKEVNTNEFH